MAEGEQDHAQFAAAIGTAGDVNGDGYYDLIVGAGRYDNPISDQGRVAVWHGGADMPAYQAAFTEQDQELAEYGSALALGDFDGDGYDEYAVGTGLFTVGPTAEAGAVWVYPGQPGLAATLPMTTLTLVNGASRFGAALANAHDVNGDGYDDLLVGAPHTPAGAGATGAAHLFLGGAAGLAASPAWSTQGEPSSDYGQAVAGAGDVNGDGYADLLAGAPTAPGSAYLYLGGPAGPSAAPDWSYSLGIDGANFGWALLGVGDIDGDGFGDVAVGAPGAPAAGGSGQVYVFMGDAEGLQATPAWIGGEVSETSETGFALAGGDFNGDGLSDLLIGAPGWDETLSDRGRVALHLSNGETLEDSPFWTRLGSQDGGRMGHAVAAADLDQDNRDEAIVGQPYVYNGQEEEGQVLIFRPETDTLIWGADGNAPLAWHGRALASRGDVNGDGFPDLATGSPGLENPHVHEGAAYLWLGNGGYLYRFFDVAPGADRHLRLRTPDDARTLALHGGLDDSQALVRALGRTSRGRGRVALEVEMKRADEPFDGSGTVQTALTDTGVPGGSGSVVELSAAFVGLSSDTRYRWRARLLSRDPLAQRSPWFNDPGNSAGEVDFRTGALVAVGENPALALGSDAVFFFAPQPVPFAESSTLSYSLKRAGQVRVAVYDVAGRRLRLLEQGRRAAGQHRLRWDGLEATGQRAASGVYLAVIEALGERHTRRLVLTR